MADVTITGLPNATTPLTGTERVPMDQAGVTSDATTQNIADLAPPTNLSYTAATRLLASSTGTDATLPLATTTDAGLQSAADKAKLDSITVDRATLTVVPVRNNSGSPIAKGQAVYVTGSSGTAVTVALADASVEATAANTLGLALDAIADNANGLVVTEGELSGINTNALTEGALVFLSETTGGLTSTRPTQPAHGVVLGWCIKQGPGTSGILYVKVDNGVELDELHDVLISSPTAGQVLRRASDGLWRNAQLAAADLSGLGTAATTASTDYLPATFGHAVITYAASVALDLAALNGTFRTISLTGNLTLTTSNLAVGRQVTVRLICDATQRNLTFPAGWVFVGTKPSTIAASKTAVLSLTFFGTADTDCVAAYGVQA